MTERIIIIVPAAGSAMRWRRVDAAGAVLASGVLVGDARLDAGDGARVTAVVPGSSVSVHWVELPRASTAQAAAAARLMAAEFIAAPLADQHVAAANDADADGMRIVAITDRANMDAWLTRLSQHGLDPDELVPAPLLLPEPAEGLSTLRAGDLLLVRGRQIAFEAEPELAELMFAGRRAEPLLRDLIDVAANLPSAALPLNLRQGAYRKAGAPLLDRRSIRSLGQLAAACAGIFLAGDAALALRYSLAADAMRDEIAAVAARALPGAGAVADPLAAINQRLQAAGAAGGFTAMTATLFAGLEASGNLRLESLRYSPEGQLRATVAGPVGSSLESLRARLASSGLNLVEGASRAGETGQRTDIEVSRL